MPAPVAVAQLLGCLSQTIPLAAIRSALTKTGRGERRRRALPAALVVQLVIGLGLVADAASRQVLAYLLPAAAKLPTKKSISRARYRLGPRPLIELFRALARPLATLGRVPQAFYRGLRLVALDATVVDLPDTPANERIFGRRRTPRGRAAFPQAKLITLLEVGVHAVFDLLVRPHQRHELIPGLALVRRSVRRGMLVLWDRGFYSFTMLRAILEQGAHFLGRAKANIVLEPVRRLSDGSYLADVYPSQYARRCQRDGLRVRVLEYRVGRQGKLVRLVTSLLDPRLDPALALATLVHERWEIELVYDEFKTHQLGRPNGQHVAIRAHGPPAVVQEIYGLVLAHRVVRTAMLAAAVREGIDPDRLSFKNALVIVRRQLPELARVSKRRLPPF
jgi:hypothetical protein